MSFVYFFEKYDGNLKMMGKRKFYKSTLNISLVKKKVFILGVLIVYILLLLFAAIGTVPSGVPNFNGADKLVHFFEFFFFALIILNFLQIYGSKKIFTRGLLIGIGFALFSEYSQLFTISRTFSTYDLFADFVGLIVGMGVFKWMFFKL
jgi:VanZ family protein